MSGSEKNEDESEDGEDGDEEDEEEGKGDEDEANEWYNHWQVGNVFISTHAGDLLVRSPANGTCTSVGRIGT